MKLHANRHLSDQAASLFVNDLVVSGTEDEIRELAELLAAGHALDIATQATIAALQDEISRLKDIVDKATCHVEDFL